MSVKVAINGYGTVGKRVADAVGLQKDMKVVGVVKTRPTFEASMAIKSNFPLFANTRENVKLFEERGMKVEGTVHDLLQNCDIVVDCTPNKVGADNKEKIYVPNKVKAIFQGGEKHHVAGTSFSALANYAESLGKDYVRVVSCNTTGLARTLSSINNKIGINNVRAVMIRRGPDPWDDRKGPVNAIVPDPPTIPSHHGPDVQTVMRDLDIITTAVKVPTTIMHMHAVNVNLPKDSSSGEITEIFEKAPRILLLSGDEGITSTAKVMEYAKDIGRRRSDLNEIAVWRESVNVVNGKELFYFQAIHQESDIIPENVDCIRAMMELTKDPYESIRMTDQALGLKKWW
ncbi:MAG: type II glyceraldehyde-3-phosphate dehydrogenase [Candidatus Aenigmarchaeota archaeon]|nr:type II glyceraldehyde-3-phosphate dehydrogenase [Candidatus Aenigmarchaeota archaeon]